ncbi:hypothetical protein YS9_2306 [Enterococcus sp. C1]|uniref:hypothetical protein n=1 Tax=Enterococcus TaxID=1350 RepID=UPI000271DCA7|nr:MULTISPECIES: hypothetical protein [Enterococcus]EJF48923.1 hypothetical protein YS9_2306 [Enterococcus sp. C1]MBX9115903.1 hypothetical protein [Enterococcus casseliflavus]MBX9126368.1 hypothetical protein [Enterococcus casseliflavus]
MTEFFIPRHLLDKIDLKHLQQFMYREGLKYQGTKPDLIDTLIMQINNEDDKQEKEQLISSYHNFLLKTIKHNSNRYVITYPIITTKHSCYYSVNNIKNSFGISDLNDLNHSEVFLGETLKMGDFTEIFRHVSESDGLITLIEVCYGKINKYRRDDDSDVVVYEYIWCEIDTQSNVLRMTMPVNSQEFIRGENSGGRSKRQKLIIKKMNKDFGLVYSEISEKQTLFKIYKYLTAHIEAPYEKQVEPYYDDINEFSESIKRSLSISNIDDINLGHRIKKLFERNLIQKDFKAFRTKKVDDGRVLSVNYSDSVGGNVKATSGGSYYNGQADQALDLQDSRVYFDIKESIYNDEELSSITVSWVNKSELQDDRFDNIEVRYTCYRGFYITHFLRYGVREEIYDYVLPKFNEYKRRPLN